MKKIFKKSNIFSFMLGAIIFGGIGTVFAYTILAKDVGYTPKDTTWKVDNVKEAIDDLYNKTNKEILNRYTVSLRAGTSFTNDVETLLNFSGSTYSNYKYFKITSLTLNDNASFGKCSAWSTKQNKSIKLNLNTEYEIFSDTDNYRFSGIMINTNSKNNGSWATCVAEIMFYNK